MDDFPDEIEIFSLDDLLNRPVPNSKHEEIKNPPSYTNNEITDTYPSVRIHLPDQIQTNMSPNVNYSTRTVISRSENLYRYSFNCAFTIFLMIYNFSICWAGLIIIGNYNNDYLCYSKCIIYYNIIHKILAIGTFVHLCSTILISIWLVYYQHSFSDDLSCEANCFRQIRDIRFAKYILSSFSVAFIQSGPFGMYVWANISVYGNVDIDFIKCTDCIKKTIPAMYGLFQCYIWSMIVYIMLTFIIIIASLCYYYMRSRNR